MANSIPKVVAMALAELPPGSVAWKKMSKQWTREELIIEVLDESEAGKTYCSELLRVSRDLIVRQANATP